MHDPQLCWKLGYGVIKHSAKTARRIEQLLYYLHEQDIHGDDVPAYRLLAAADRLTNAAMWLAVHEVYARQVYLDGRTLSKEDFKPDPQGHLGATLNMIPAYVGYLLANALTGITRAWVMEQGHAVAAIDTVNLLVNNMLPDHHKHYQVNDAGLTQYVRDFYSYQINAQGRQASPLGSHVNAYTAGGHMEGGYLGFTSIQYPHMPLKGEHLVAFLSDGAFEEQKGADLTSHWWRSEDSGYIAPIMIANGRRIDQRSIIEQRGGASWFKKYLKLHGFDPIIFSGRDPAAFAWAIIEQEKRLHEYAKNAQAEEHVDVKIPYGIAIAPKGAGFFNEGTNAAHNLPLVENPFSNPLAADRFNTYVKRLYVSPKDMSQVSEVFQKHHSSGRIQEKLHPIANRQVTLRILPSPTIHHSVRLRPMQWSYASAVDGIDYVFSAITTSNNHLRARVGNPDEIRSNRMLHTLKTHALRVNRAEEGLEESTLGNVITTLNEEAVAAAAFGNKGGINLIVTYEAFGAKMFGQARQEVTFSKQQKDLGRPAQWLSVPIILTSHTWENSKNELSHQDPSLTESMFAETSDISRVMFPADIHCAQALMLALYQTHGQIWSVVVPKQKTPVFFTEEEASLLIQEGGVNLSWVGYESEKAQCALIAIGAYQLHEVLKASERLVKAKVPHIVSYILEPGRFRKYRNKGEKKHLAQQRIQNRLIPEKIEHVLFVTHTRPEIMIGSLQPLWDGRTVNALGFINQGGTLGIDGMLYVNHCSWAHILKYVAEILEFDATKVLTHKELKALNRQISPDGIITNMESESH